MDEPLPQDPLTVDEAIAVLADYQQLGAAARRSVRRFLDRLLAAAREHRESERRSPDTSPSP